MLRAAEKWLWGYARSAWSRPRRPAGPVHVLFCLVDHFEPFGGGAGRPAAVARVERWVREYPARFGALRDSAGRTPRHTFFYPGDEYDRGVVELLTALPAGGWGEIEVHLHHRGDTREGLRGKLESFRDTLRADHGCLGSDGRGRPVYGFIHGNWALCNSRPDGDWCGVNGELSVLAETGCYADFTFPSAPSPTQPRRVNSVYYAADAPGGAARGHDRGQAVAAGRPGFGLYEEARGRLMLIQGPLALDCRRRKWGLLPRIENGEVTAVNPATIPRMRLWVRCGIAVGGRPDWVIVKVHTHGCAPNGMEAVLGDGLARALGNLQAGLGDRSCWAVHFVTARELYNTVKAAEAGLTGNPQEYKDFCIGSPPVMRA